MNVPIICLLGRIYLVDSIIPGQCFLEQPLADTEAIYLKKFVIRIFQSVVKYSYINQRACDFQMSLFKFSTAKSVRTVNSCTSTLMVLLTITFAAQIHRDFTPVAQVHCLCAEISHLLLRFTACVHRFHTCCFGFQLV